jgi:hypothetical protein
MQIMSFKKWVRHILLNESIKEIELNRILDKISNNKKLDSKEQSFLDLYNSLKDRDMQDYVLLSKQSTFERIKDLIDSGATVICNLSDREGPIGLKIIDMFYNWDAEKVILNLDKGAKFTLDDRFLYNIISKGNNKWSLEAHDEYFEKLPINKEE